MCILPEVSGMHPVLMKLLVVYFYSSANYTLLSDSSLTLQAKESRTEIKSALLLHWSQF